MRPILIIAAISQEILILENALQHATHSKTQALTSLEGMIGEQKVILCAGGAGKVNAAITAAALLERYSPGMVINTGCAGAYSGSGLAIGDLAVASDEYLGDEGVLTGQGWQDLSFMRLPSIKIGDRNYFNEIPLSRPATEKAVQVAGQCGVNLVCGRFLTVSTCSGTEIRGEELARRHNVICENMEGAAIALACLRYGAECLEIRGISNLVEERNMATWDIPRAVEAAQRFVIKFLEGI